jgi:hypothetical protein
MLCIALLGMPTHHCLLARFMLQYLRLLRIPLLLLIPFSPPTLLLLPGLWQ